MLKTRDFTLQRYALYLDAIKSNYNDILRFDEYFLLDKKPDSFCIIRHDVDRKPFNALKMAEVERKAGIRATYYFRTKANTFKPYIINSIADLGHEIGYHYECLSESRGNIDNALLDFHNNLKKLRQFYPVTTIAMHGSPLSKFDNRQMWKNPVHHKLLSAKYDIHGDVYLDIDYTDIAYISDTGRNWSSTTANIRDKVISKISSDFESGNDLYEYFLSHPHHKLVFQTHPERWASNSFDFSSQLCKDLCINIIKIILKRIR